MTDTLPPDSDLTDAEAEELLLMCGHAPGPEPLSPAALAVLDVVVPYPIHEQAIAAALRAVAEQVIEEVCPVEAILTIADELEATYSH